MTLNKAEDTEILEMVTTLSVEAATSVFNAEISAWKLLMIRKR
jgi:hypothetical protein